MFLLICWVLHQSENLSYYNSYAWIFPNSKGVVVVVVVVAVFGTVVTTSQGFQKSGNSSYTPIGIVGVACRLPLRDAMRIGRYNLSRIFRFTSIATKLKIFNLNPARVWNLCPWTTKSRPGGWNLIPWEGLGKQKMRHYWAIVALCFFDRWCEVFCTW